jgi:hypothetical protein
MQQVVETGITYRLFENIEKQGVPRIRTPKQTGFFNSRIEVTGL